MDKQHDTNGSSKDTGLVVKRQPQIEAISKAIYLVTDLVEKDEPIRNMLRKVSIELLDSNNKTESLQKLHSVLRLAKDIQLVSDMNASLLIAAIEKTLVVLVKGRESSVGETLKAQLMADEPASTHGDHQDDHTARSTQVHNPRVSTAPSATSERPAASGHIEPHKAIEQPKDKHPQTHPLNVPVLDIGSRRKRILEVVRAKGQATINEFIESIRGCSSKTIQRELTSLELSGTLKKTGERRWSRYSLK